MYKKNFYLFCFFLVSNCSMPGTAFLGPVYTGAKTGSVYQTSLSYSSGKIIQEIQSNVDSVRDPVLSDIVYIEENPKVLISYKVDYVEFSDVIEPEPLP